MCSNYRASPRSVVRDLFDAEWRVPAAVVAPVSASTDAAAAAPEYGLEVWPGSYAPMIRRDPEQPGRRIAELGVFGLIPAWAKDRKHARKTYNARSETVATKPSFRRSWHGSRFALVPMTAFYEPYYQGDARPVRWSVSRKDGQDFAAAAIWSFWRDPSTGQGVPSFSMLTVNADGHPVMCRLHAPDDEKRSISLVPRAEWDTWLDATPELARVMLQLPDPDEVQLTPAPVPPRRPAAITM